MEDRRTELHPEVRADLERKRAAGAMIERDQLSIEEVRQQNVDRNERLGFLEDPEPVGDVREHTIRGPGGGIPVRIFVPEGDGPFPMLVFFHGGGWIRGTIDGVDPICRHVANEVGCSVLAPTYRLAPEDTFPAAVEDAYAAVEWAANNPHAANGDPDRLAVGGKSAGGTQATVAALMARDRGGPSIDFQVIGAPVTDYSFDTDSYRENAEGYGLTRRGMKYNWETYLGDPIHGRHPYASPLQARDLSGLPPALVVTAGFDPLRDDGILYAERLREAGVETELRNYPDMIHGLLGSAYFVNDVGRSREAVGDVCAALKEAFGTE
ncbi:MAG: alpha/beta hydrolase [Salinigranum sp.]